jgi:tyrosyl-tRNA synthetase
VEFNLVVGKHIFFNYMTPIESVKKRLDTGMSFTEFSYQLVQGYDFFHLYQENGVKLQMGGSDQWGNITTGTELIRRKCGGEAFALTSPLIKKADGGKFGKTESGTIWLDSDKTSPYAFYQFWMNTGDVDAESYIRIFTLRTNENIEKLIEEHRQAPHMRLLQRTLAEDVTAMVHSQEDLDAAIEASQILFGKGTRETLVKMDEKTFLAVFEGVPQFSVSRDLLNQGISVVELLAGETAVFPSKGELRRTIKGGGVSLNKDKITDPDTVVNADSLLNDKYLLAQKGKKNYFLIIAQ